LTSFANGANYLPPDGCANVTPARGSYTVGDVPLACQFQAGPDGYAVSASQKNTVSCPVLLASILSGKQACCSLQSPADWSKDHAGVKSLPGRDNCHVLGQRGAGGNIRHLSLVI